MHSKRSKWAWLLWAGGGAFGLVALFVVFALVSSRLRRSRHYEVTVRDVAPVSGEAALAEGKRLYLSRGCGECHGQRAEGRVVIDGPPGLLVASNLTVYAASASRIDFVRAVRHGLARDGRPLLLMPSNDFQGLDDRELSEIIAYVQSLPRAVSRLPEPRVRPLGAVLHVLGLFPLLAAERLDHAHLPQAFPARESSVAYGKTLAAGCTGCHGEHLSGGPIPGAPPELGVPANLTPDASGLLGWSEADFRRALREGVDPRGHRLDPKQMPWPTLGQMNDTELGALFAYLKSVPPQPAGQR